MTVFELFLSPARIQESSDARRLAGLFEIVADLLLQKRGSTIPEEWDKFRNGFFGSSDDRHDRDDLRVSLCFHEAWTSTCNTLSALPFDRLDEMANSLKTRAAVLRDRARPRIRWRRTSKIPLRKVV